MGAGRKQALKGIVPQEKDPVQALQKAQAHSELAPLAGSRSKSGGLNGMRTLNAPNLDV
jgi:hypothetical protein